MRDVRWLGPGPELIVRYGNQTHVVRVQGDVGMPLLVGHEAPIIAASFRADGAHVATADTAGLPAVTAPVCALSETAYETVSLA